MTEPHASTSLSADDFRIKDLRRDPEAMLLIIVGVVILLAAVLLLAFLPDAAWNRLMERVQVLYVAAVALIPICMAAWQRFNVRRAGARALGETAAAVGPELARNELYVNAAAAEVREGFGGLPAGVTKAGQ